MRKMNLSARDSPCSRDLLTRGPRTRKLTCRSVVSLTSWKRINHRRKRKIIDLSVNSLPRKALISVHDW